MINSMVRVDRSGYSTEIPGSTSCVEYAAKARSANQIQNRFACSNPSGTQKDR